MTETTARYEYQEDDRDEGLNWARIAGISAAIAVHVAALMLLMDRLVWAILKPAKKHKKRRA